MFKFGSALRDVKPELAETDQSVPVSVDDVVKALRAIGSKDCHAYLACLPAPLQSVLEDLNERMLERDETLLRQTVDYSMQASNAMAATARITGAIRETDEHAAGISEAVDVLSASIDQISDTAAEAAHSMEEAHNALASGVSATSNSAAASQKISTSFAQMSDDAGQLAEAAEQIGMFVATIEGLAQQTNLLALNATIEAARAGEAGKGFAVVASEVKQLSGQTSKATDDIRARIERLQTHVAEVLTTVEGVQDLVSSSAVQSEEAAGQIESVLGSVSATNDRMTSISELLSQQTGAAQMIAEGMHAVARHAQAGSEFAEDAIKAVAGSETIINSQFADLEERDIRNYVLHRAKSDHLLWKKRLAEMLVGRNALREEELSDHHSCRLGKWYDGVTDPALRAHQAFAALPKVHEAVHESGKEAARRFAAGDRGGAFESIAAMDKASDEVLALIDQLLDQRSDGSVRRL